jgi:prepilin-type N-terminal cleavage/methylation domain-containing protein/prepilin-type processing-associated H-X9-DG protein
MKTNHNQGFTLIELLVVIAIISLLAAILFPVFAQARSKARQATCLSNMKQIATAVNMYTQDYDETMPASGFSTDVPTAPTVWAGQSVVGAYVKNISVYHCPEDGTEIMPEIIDRLPATRKKNVGPLSYAINGIPQGNLVFGMTNAQGAFGFAQTQPQTVLSMVNHPADLVMFTDGRRDLDGLHVREPRWANTEYAFWFTINPTAPLDFGFMFESDLYNAAEGTVGNKIWRKHSGGTNVTFMDTHAKWMQPKQLMDGKFWVANWPN